MTYTKADVQRLIEKGDFVVQRVLEKDEARYKADTYKVWFLVYDQNSKIVQNFYVCSLCGLFQNIVQKLDGNHKMTRHNCYVKYMEQLANGEIKDETDGHANEGRKQVETCLEIDNSLISNAKLNLLARTFFDFSKLNTSHLDFEGWKQMIPKTWNADSW